MQVKRLREVQETIESASFVAWYEKYRQARARIRRTEEELEDLLAHASMLSFRAERTVQAADEAVFRAGELEGLAAEAQARASEVENGSFEALSAFEQERQRASDAWATLGVAEDGLEQERQAASDLRFKIEAMEREGSHADSQERHRLSERLRALEESIRQRAEEVEVARRHLAEAERRRDELWAQVEEAWSQVFAANMARSEYAYRARRTQGEAEKLFRKADEQRAEAERLNEEAEARRESLDVLRRAFGKIVLEGREHFGCTLIEEFCYWQRRDDVRQAWVVPLIDENEHLNVQVEALRVYSIDRTRGLDFIEPIPEDQGLETEEDPRLDAFFDRSRQAPARPA